MTGPLPPDWRVVAASATGGRHLEAARENQDAWVYRSLNGGRFVVAVADGAGSREYSAIGSRLAVHAASDSARPLLAAGPPEDAVGWSRFASGWAQACTAAYAALVVAASGVFAAARADGEPGTAGFATTLLAVLASPPWFGYLAVGDSFLVARREPGGVHLVVPPPPAPHRAVTSFLTAAGNGAVLRSGVIADARLTGLALCTDGMAEAVLDSDRGPDGEVRYLAPAEFAGYFEVFADPKRSATELTDSLHSPDVAATSGDDKTMVLAVRR